MTLTRDWLQKFGWPETLITGHPLAIAHRGASDYAPENTLKSFQIAADLCSEMWELDIRLSADGVCVVAHDDNLTRVARRGLRVSAASWDEISSLRLPEEQHVSRLEEVIELAKITGCGLYIEIKSSGAGPLAWALLKEAEFKFAALVSFNPIWINDLRDEGCDYPLGILVPVGADPFTYLAGVEVDIVHLCWRDASDNPHELLTDELMQEFDDRGLQIVIWHEDRATVLDALWDVPVMGICSNRPELLKPYRQDPTHPIDIVCHRGAIKLAPENTLEAARICIDQRFQFVELDVRTTNDGELVVIHDASLDRTTDGTGLVIDNSFLDIRALDAGSWFREGSAGFRVPAPQHMLKLVSASAGLYFEVKHADPARLLDMIGAHDMLNRCFFWGYDIDVMRKMRALSADVILMAPRWMYNSVREAATAYDAQIVEFDAFKDNLDEINLCNDLGVKSMIFSTTSDWGDLGTYLKYSPDMVNLDYPDRFKILASYPEVRHHFETTLGCGYG
ncbi:MAG: glycerophosphodiester phosphodiesterase family protein [Paracoccaceae bacterium]